MNYADQRAAEQQKAAALGQLPFLDDTERKQQERLFSSTETFPKKFWSTVVDHIAVNGLEIPISQIRGRLPVRSSKITGGLQGTSSTTYVDLSTAGPTLEGLADGDWIFLYGAYIEEDADAQAYMSLSINGDAASDDDSCSLGVDGLAGDEVRGTIMTATLKTLENSGNNTVTAKYKAAVGAVNFTNRWIIGLKIGN